MSFNQNLFELASEQINLALQKMLGTDPANKVFIARLEGVKIKIDCTQPDFSFLVAFQGNTINLQKFSDSELESEAGKAADLQLTGTAINLLQLAATPIDNASGLHSSNISINGDVGLLLELSQVAKMIDIDWELLIAHKIGETPAVLISRTISSSFREARKLQQILSKKVAEKMQSESSPLPNKDELNRLKTKLRDLNYRLDRLEVSAKSNPMKAAL